MLAKSIRFFIQNKLVAILVLLAIIVSGLVVAPFEQHPDWLPKNMLAVDAIPDIGENQQIVHTQWDGRSPQDIEDQITYPLTTTLLGIPGVKTIRSSSMFGFSTIYIIFEEDIDFYWSRSRILEKLNALPKGLLPNGVNPTLGPDATGLGQVFWYTLEGRDPEGNVTGGWDLQELRSIQDNYVKYSLASAEGVSEAASIGGYVKEYQIDVDPELMRQYGITLSQIVNAVKQTNTDIGAQTLEINNVEYFVRGLGYVKDIKDIENTVITAPDYTPVTLKQLGKVTMGPAARRGLLDKEGAEVVGGVIVARYGSNPMEVINHVKAKIGELNPGLPQKTLKDGTSSQVTIVPFYDRSQLIKETIGTLNEALTLEILITVIVILVMVFNLRVSVLISGLLPIAVLLVFATMKITGIDANIVSLSGIAIAIGTMVDLGIILCENIIRHLDEDQGSTPIDTLVYKATEEVSGAIITAVLTTIISFIPVFAMIGSEGKLFRPLAFTKTFALLASLLITLFIIPALAALFFKRRNALPFFKKTAPWLWIIAGVLVIVFTGLWVVGVTLIAFGIIALLVHQEVFSTKQSTYIKISIVIAFVIITLANYWNPLGVDHSTVLNLLFVGLLCLGILGLFTLFRKYYVPILNWTLNHKLLFLALPLGLLISAIVILKNTGREFMPSLNEGSFLLMPTSMPHAGIEENKRILQQLDMAVAAIPEIESVVGKAGRAESALDPAPISMYENMIQYRSEYMIDDSGSREKYKVNKNGLFILHNNKLAYNPNNKVSDNALENQDIIAGITVNRALLIPDEDGAYFRNWRPEIQTPDDIWKAISNATKLPGITSAPKLQPIETRLVMLQTGMRAPMGIKIKGQDLKQIEAFGIQLETLLKQVEGVKTEAVFADRIVGKPYLLIDINREQIARYGLTIQQVQDQLKVAVGGMPITTTVEGRERYDIRIRYPRELRNSPDELNNLVITLGNDKTVPLQELATIKYEQGPQVIKSEDTFLTGYVLFDKLDGFAEVNVVENARNYIEAQIAAKKLTVPSGVTYSFTGTYENQIRATKTLSFIVPIVLVIIFLILYFQFRSVATSLLIFSGIAVAFSGGLLAIWLYGETWFLNFSLFGINFRELFNMHQINLSVAVWVGFIALFGIATDDGVVMATYLQQTFARIKPNSVDQIKLAVKEAGAKRIRPCLMTTATTLLALLPVLTSTGRGSDIMIPMAIPSFGGMLIALITLFIVPVLYSWKEEFKLKKRNA